MSAGSIAALTAGVLFVTGIIYLRFAVAPVRIAFRAGQRSAQESDRKTLHIALRALDVHLRALDRATERADAAEGRMALLDVDLGKLREVADAAHNDPALSIAVEGFKVGYRKAAEEADGQPDTALDRALEESRRRIFQAQRETAGQPGHDETEPPALRSAAA